MKNNFIYYKYIYNIIGTPLIRLLRPIGLQRTATKSPATYRMLSRSEFWRALKETEK